MSEKGGPKRTKEQRMSDLEAMAEMLSKGKSTWEVQAEMARLQIERGNEAIGERAFLNDLAEINARNLNRALISYNQGLSEQLAEHDSVERAAWIAWERSCQAATSEDIQNTEDVAVLAHGVSVPIKRKKIKRTTVSGVGDPKYLQIIGDAIDARCKLLGLYGDPQEIDWRQQARQAGLDDATASSAFEGMVEGFYRALEAKAKKDGENGDKDSQDPGEAEPDDVE